MIVTDRGDEFFDNVYLLGSVMTRHALRHMMCLHAFLNFVMSISKTVPRKPLWICRHLEAVMHLPPLQLLTWHCSSAPHSPQCSPEFAPRLSAPSPADQPLPGCCVPCGCFLLNILGKCVGYAQSTSHRVIELYGLNSLRCTVVSDRGGCGQCAAILPSAHEPVTIEPAP